MLAPLTFTALVALMTFALCLCARPIGYALSLVDKPAAKAHALHDAETPLVGGLAILLPWIFASFVYARVFPVSPASANAALLSEPLIGLVSFFLILGAVDDRYHLSARSRLWISAAAYLTIVLKVPVLQLGSISLPDLGVGFSLGYLGIPFTVLCLVALTNAVNMADGRNALVIGMCCIWTIALLFRLPDHVQPMALGLLAALLITGLFNWRGWLFLGDAGTYSLACLIGLWAVGVHNGDLQSGALTSSQLATLFAVPAFDMLRLIVLRLHLGVSIMSPDRDHLHHRLDRFCGWNVGLAVYLLAVALPIMLAMSGPQAGLPGLCLAFVLYVVIWAFTRQVASPAMNPL